MGDIRQHIPAGLDTDSLIEALASEHAEVRSLAAVALGHFGPDAQEAIEPLSGLLLEGDDSYDLRDNIVVALGQICGSDEESLDVGTLLKDLWDERPVVRARAAALLGLVQQPEDVTSAVAALKRALGDSAAEIREIALDALGRLGRPAMAVLTDIICTDDGLSREALKAMESVEGPVIENLIEIYELCSPRVRMWILSTIGELHSVPEKVRPFLINVLDNPDTDVCWNAIGALEKYGPEAEPAIPRLVRAITQEYERYTNIPFDWHDHLDEEFWEDNDDPSFEEISYSEAISSIVDVLAAIGPSAETTIPVLVELLENAKDPSIQEAAFRAILKIGPSEQEQKKLITYLIGEDEERRWRELAEDLRHLPVTEQQMRQLLDFCLRKMSAEHQPACYGRDLAQMIRRDGATGCVAMLTSALNDPNDSVVERAALMLAELGDMATTAVPSLVTAYGPAGEDARIAILSALGCIGSVKTADKVLLEALQHGDGELRFQAALALGRLGHVPRTILLLLQEGLAKWDPQGQLGAAFMLLKHDPQDPEALSVLVASLSREDMELSSWSESLLAEIGRPVLDALFEALEDENMRVDAITDILECGKFQLTLEDLRDPVQSFLKDCNPKLRYAGADLVRKFPDILDCPWTMASLWRNLTDSDHYVQMISACALQTLMEQELDVEDRPTIRIDLGL